MLKGKKGVQLKQCMFSDHYRTPLPSSGKYFLGVSAQASLELATEFLF